MMRAAKRRAAIAAACLALAGCAGFGARDLASVRGHYNEAVKATAEEQLLLNIVRLRYGDTPSSLAVSGIALQYEQVRNLQIIPLFTAAGGDNNRSYTALLPQAGIASADRPTITLTPMDDVEFTRRLFTPLPVEGVLYFAKTTWPIETIFRLYLENLNWVPNAQTASGPTPAQAPEYGDFLRGIKALQALQDRSQAVFSQEERVEEVGGPLPAASVSATAVVEAAKNGFEYRADEGGKTWTLSKRSQQPVLRIDPAAAGSPEMAELARIFRLKRGLAQYDIKVESLSPFPATYPAEGVTTVDLETRSLLQVLYFVGQGVEVPPEHLAQGVARATTGGDGRPFDWRGVLGGLFRVASAAGDAPPPGAHVAVQYRGRWFYIAETDLDTKTTFSFLLHASRLELTGRNAAGVVPLLTLPLGGK